MTYSFAGRDFTLPLGYLDSAGGLHRYGQMRLATAFDEIEPLGDSRVKDNEAFLGLLLLSRVVVRLGEYAPVPLEVIAGLYAADFSYLQTLYIEFNRVQGMSLQSSAGLPRDLMHLDPLPHDAEVAAPAPGFVPLRGSIETVCPQCQAELVLDLDTAVQAPV